MSEIIVLLKGACQGISLQIAKDLASLGYRVFITPARGDDIKKLGIKQCTQNLWMLPVSIESEVTMKITIEKIAEILGKNKDTLYLHVFAEAKAYRIFLNRAF